MCGEQRSLGLASLHSLYTNSASMTTIEIVTKAMGEMFDEGWIVDMCASDRFEEGFMFDVVESGNKKSYIVFQSEEIRDKAVGVIIRDMLALCTPSFLRRHLVVKLSDEVIVAIKNTCQACETIYDLVKDFDTLVDDAVNKDGRGFYLATYDEIEMSTYYEGVTYYYYRTD